MNDPSVILRDGLRQLAVPEADRVHRMMEMYLDELERWNPRFGLVNTADRGELVIKHVLDSLAGLSIIRGAIESTGGAESASGGAESASGGAVLDVGSGAGFPGIPLAAAMPGVSVTLLERMARRVSFLKTCVVLLGLPLLRVVHADLADADGAYDVVTFRAVAPLGRFLGDIGKSGVTWRVAVAYKGREDRAREEIDDVRRSSADVDELRVVPLRPPFLSEERCLIVARKNPPLTSARGNPPSTSARRKGIVDKEVRPG